MSGKAVDDDDLKSILLGILDRATRHHTSRHHGLQLNPTELRQQVFDLCNHMAVTTAPMQLNSAGDCERKEPSEESPKQDDKPNSLTSDPWAIQRDRRQAT